MESPKAAKRRMLPAWMTNRAAEPVPEAKRMPKRRKMVALPRVETIYCMNEAELVDMALCILAENCKDKETEAISSEDEVRKTQQAAMNPQWSEENGSDQASSPPVAPKPPALDCNQKATLEKEDDEDDALKYARHEPAKMKAPFGEFLHFAWPSVRKIIRQHKVAVTRVRHIVVQKYHNL